MGILCEKFKLKLACSDESKKELETSQFLGLKELDNFDGLVLCRTKDEKLRCSKQFLQIAKAQNGDKVSVKGKDFNVKAQIQLDESLQGTVGFLNFKHEGFDFVQVMVERA